MKLVKIYFRICLLNRQTAIIILGTHILCVCGVCHILIESVLFWSVVYAAVE